MVSSLKGVFVIPTKWKAIYVLSGLTLKKTTIGLDCKCPSILRQATGHKKSGRSKQALMIVLGQNGWVELELVTDK